MYIRSLELNNIRAIEHFEMSFLEGKEAGWHVLIGDNGSGKSTIVKSMALALLRPSDISATHEDWDNWLKQNVKNGYIDLHLYQDLEVDARAGKIDITVDTIVENRIEFRKRFEKHDDEETIEDETPPSIDKGESRLWGVKFLGVEYTEISKIRSFGTDIENSNSIINGINSQVFVGWFSVAYGPFRRFTGGNPDKEKVFVSNPRLGAHFSIFDEDVALSEALNYLRELYIKSLEEGTKNSSVTIHKDTLSYIIKFISQSNLLPHNTVIDGIDSSSIYFRDGNGNRIQTIQMSDGFRSVLSLTFELIRQLIRVYGSREVFRQISQDNMIIDLPGVVIVDEIDAHLHPTWQTRIGHWFLKHFPNLQFIVTTHSPLVCRACEKGSIWRLAAPGSERSSGEVTGIDRDRLIYGNILDAYGTEVFGQDVERSDESKEKLERLAHLSQLSSFGKITELEEKEMNQLRKILITDDTTEF